MQHEEKQGVLSFLSVVGSPRKGNSHALARLFCDEAGRAGWLAELLFVPQIHVRGCSGCYQFCTTRPGIECVHEDDMNSVIERMISADLTLFAAPLYNGGYPSVMSGFLERCLPLWEGHQTEETLICDRVLTKGNKAILAIVQEEQTEDAARLAFEVFDHTIGHIFGYDVIDRINVRGVKSSSDLKKDENSVRVIKACAFGVFHAYANGLKKNIRESGLAWQGT